MNLLDIFKPIPSMTAGEVRQFLAGRDPDSFNLVDVRQPGEYERGHLPGARLIPLPELNARLQEIDRGKPTIVY
ncbi:MAG: rhodanese-like domain-containing protein [Desulfobacteraceae bacterium]|nr:rhodanese-like domain-containing protein [Desulfobacteraceae bacterium]